MNKYTKSWAEWIHKAVLKYITAEHTKKEKILKRPGRQITYKEQWFSQQQT